MDIELFSSLSEEETNQLGVDFSRRLSPGVIVCFYGELGAGKTEFIRGICEGLQVSDLVSSPTYTIINQYSGFSAKNVEITIYHVDLYRIEAPKDLVEIGLEELLNDEKSLKFIEWAENAQVILPPIRYDVYFHTVDENSRRIEIIHRVETSLASASGMQRLLR